MHPDTEKLIKHIKATKGKVLSFELKNARDAKNRQDSLRMARKRGHVRYKALHHGSATEFGGFGVHLRHVPHTSSILAA